MHPLLAQTLRIDWKAVDRPFAIRCAIGVTAGILIGYSTGEPFVAVAAGMGAMSTGFASLQGFYRTRVVTMLAMAIAMAISTIVGSLCAHDLRLELVALGVWGIGYGLFSALGTAASAVALNAMISLVIFSNFPLDAKTAATCGLFVIIGGCVQTALVVFGWPFQRYPQERGALASAYDALAAYADAIDCVTPALPPATSLTAVRNTLADPRPFGRSTALAAFQTLLDEAERIRATLGSISVTACSAFPPVRSVTVRALRSIAASLRRGRASDDDALFQALEARSDDELVRALFGQLRAALRNVSLPFEGGRLPGRALPPIEWFDFSESLQVLRSNISLDATFGRHAVRVAATLLVTASLAHLLPLQRGYWMTLTAALVLRPDFTATFSRGIARILGTLIGVVLATALAAALPETPHAMLALAIVFAAVGYAAFQMNYGLYTVTVTAYVVFILALIGTPEHTAVVSRTLATLAGGTIAMLGYVVWPTWEAPHARTHLTELVTADRAYARLLFVGLIDPAQRDSKMLARERASLWAIRAQAETSLERMLAEPSTNDDLPRDAALGIMAATKRIGLANLSLATIYGSPSTPALPQLAPFARALETAFATTEAALSGETAPPQTTALRDAYAALEASTEPTPEALLATLDMMVDAVNTMSDLARAAATGT